jgi:hypothetical protein
VFAAFLSLLGGWEAREAAVGGPSASLEWRGVGGLGGGMSLGGSLGGRLGGIQKCSDGSTSAPASERTVYCTRYVGGYDTPEPVRY